MAAKSPSEHDGIWIPPGSSYSPPEPDAGAADPAAEEPVVAEAPEDLAPEPQPDYQDLYLRALADLDNVRKRTAEQQRQAIARANERFIEDLLPVIDGIDRGITAAQAESTVEALQQGLELVSRQLHTFLETHGVETIACEVGDEFDPERHEAMFRQPATDEVPDGHIAAVMERGIVLHGRVVRPARVAVAAAPFDAQA